jgi:hypothetical protein
VPGTWSLPTTMPGLRAVSPRLGLGRQCRERTLPSSWVTAVLHLLCGPCSDQVLGLYNSQTHVLLATAFLWDLARDLLGPRQETRKGLNQAPISRVCGAPTGRWPGGGGGTGHRPQVTPGRGEDKGRRGGQVAQTQVRHRGVIGGCSAL